jgi:hypothetical protein
MIKRVRWFAAGVAAGAAGSTYVARKVRRTARALAPASVARRTMDRAKAKGADIAEAVRDGRRAMRAKEAELRAAHDGDRVVAVEPGQVIVLQDVRESSSRRAAR